MPTACRVMQERAQGERAQAKVRVELLARLVHQLLLAPLARLVGRAQAAVRALHVGHLALPALQLPIELRGLQLRAPGQSRVTQKVLHSILPLLDLQTHSAPLHAAVWKCTPTTHIE